MSVITGKGRHRRKNDETNQWESGDEDTEIEVKEKVVQEPSTLTSSKQEEPLIEDDEQNIEDLSSLRDKSRSKYLQRRQETKLEELGKEIKSYQDRINSLTYREKQDYEHKKNIYDLVKGRESLKRDSEQSSEYQLPQDYVNDRKRKLGVLNEREKVQEVELEQDQPKRNRYDSQWERDQLDRATLGKSLAKPDAINLPGQEDYEYVFDESQFVDFEEENTLEGSNKDSELPTKQPEISEASSYKAVRESLPVFSYRERFLSTLESHQILIVVGETGSGKTTQLPQYLHEAGYSKGNKKIGCTQPRRVAATSVANRVADEMGCKIGQEVGYSIRFEDESSDKTVIKYLTDGMLLREFLTDPELSSYGALMIDEAHERTVSTEIILSLLKDILKVRTDLKLVVASATMNAQKFSTFFDDAPVFNIPGRRFPVDIHYTKAPEANYIQAAITTVFQIHTTQERGDILVFLTGQEEIETMQESLEEAATKMDLKSSDNQLLICPIYANLPPEQQSKIFEPTPPNSRKVVLATNIAETSITIEGVSYVIDPGYVKENVFNPISGMESLVVVPCSRASADQRAGRAGRVGPGKCFRLYTKWSFYNELQANPTPEILRVNLTSIVLLLLSMGVTDLIGFDFMDPPSPDTLMKSLELLYALGALNAKGMLTRVGRQMVEFPIDPMFAKCLITSSRFGVTQEILSVISMLGESSNLFYRPKDKKEAADKCKEKFHQEQGDHLTLLEIWKEWVDTGYSSQWCQDNYVQYKTLKRAREVREQLSRLCIKAGISVDQKDEPRADSITQMIQKSITSGFFPNIARLSKMGDSFRTLKKNQAVYIHPSSSIFPTKPPPKLLLYHELVLTSKEFMRNCMLVDDRWLSELAPHYYNDKELDLSRK
ncbi:pre-mRNA-splicing factor ATP-dependent RNA helicase-like protein Prp2p [[Candida] anglica]|uniref:RNA helicase n=1 Tax=[Candida] anglica TaxID=148631 RepID=A0ABP0EDN5_9ASCO